MRIYLKGYRLVRVYFKGYSLVRAWGVDEKKKNRRRVISVCAHCIKVHCVAVFVVHPAALHDHGAHAGVAVDDEAGVR